MGHLTKEGSMPPPSCAQLPGVLGLPHTFAQLPGALGALGPQLLQTLSSTALKAIVNTGQALSRLAHSILTGNL